MPAPAQHSQHSRGVICVGRLAKHRAVHNDNRVGANDERVGLNGRYGDSLSARQAFGVRHGRFARMLRFVNVGRAYLVRDADQAKQLAAARRG